jgi:hypothetical protein
VIDTGGIDVFLGLDVGKGEHHATAVTPAGKKAFDKRLPNTEPKLRKLFAKLQAKHGTVLVVVDQPASIGALPLAAARDMGRPQLQHPLAGFQQQRVEHVHHDRRAGQARGRPAVGDLGGGWGVRPGVDLDRPPLRIGCPVHRKRLTARRAGASLPARNR